MSLLLPSVYQRVMQVTKDDNSDSPLKYPLKITHADPATAPALPHYESAMGDPSPNRNDLAIADDPNVEGQDAWLPPPDDRLADSGSDREALAARRRAAGWGASVGGGSADSISKGGAK